MRSSHLLVMLSILGSVLPIHQVLSLPDAVTEQSMLNSESNSQKDNVVSTPASNYSDKHKMFQTCQAFELDPDDYVMFENGTAYVEAYNRSYNSSFYQLVDGMLRVCVPETEDNATSVVENPDGSFKFSSAFMYLTVIGLGISILCLVLHLVAFFMVPELRNLPGYNTASLCVSLLLGYTCFLCSHTELVQGTVQSCVLFSAATQFFFLSSFLWSSAIAFDVFRTLLKATGKLRLVTTRFSVKRYSIYCLYAWGTPVVFVTVTLVLDNVEGVPEDYVPMIGREMCWIGQRTALLILFAAPIFTVIMMNVLFFAMSAYIIFSNRIQSTETVHRQMLKKNFAVYFRLSVLMGLTWIVGVLAGVVNKMWLWYVFAVLNTLQGFFIFVAFTCSRKVRNNLRERFASRNRKVSCQSSSLPTFQSYFNSAFSAENDKPPDYGKELDGSPLAMKKVSISDEKKCSDEILEQNCSVKLDKH